MNFVGFSTNRHHLLVHDLVRDWTVWDTSSGRQIPFPYADRHQGIFTPSGEVFGASVAGESVTWNLVTGQPKVYQEGKPVHPLFPVISTNGRVLAVADPATRRVHLGSAATFDLTRQLPENSYCGGRRSR